MRIFETQLRNNFDENQNLIIEYHEDIKTILITIWTDGVAFVSTAANSGNREAIESWNGLVDSMVSLTNSLKSLIETGGDFETNVALFLLNDINMDNVLLSVRNGVVWFNAVD
jgi:hypothetical protein